MTLLMDIGGLGCLAHKFHAHDLHVQTEPIRWNAEACRIRARKRMWRHLHKLLAARGWVNRGGCQFWVSSEHVID